MWTRDQPTTAASPRNGTATGGSTLPTPVANANAAAAWPDGNEVEVGHRHVTDLWHLLGGAVGPAAPEPLQPLVDDHAGDRDRGDPVERGDAPARSAARGQQRRGRERDAGIVGGMGELRHGTVERRGLRARDRRVEGHVESLGVLEPVGHGEMMA